MRLRLVSSSIVTGVLLTATLAAAVPSPAAAAPTCVPGITVLPLAAGAGSGVVTAAVPGLAVGYVFLPRRVNRAVQWRYTHRHWEVRGIPGVAALGASVSTVATGVNRHGAITVSATRPDSYTSRAYVAADGVLHPLLDGARGYDASAEDISDSGRVVGAALDQPTGVHMPVRWDYWDQVPRVLWATTSSSTATAVDVNDDVAGSWFTSAHWGGGAFRIDGDGSNQELDLGPYDHGDPSYAVALDLNSSERTVGFGSTPTGSGAFVWDGGVRTVLPLFPGVTASDARATAVSERGTVVGVESTRAGSESPPVPHVLFWTDAVTGSRSLLPASGRWADAATANDVTDDGRVYGSSVVQAGLPAQPTVWDCAAQQAFVPRQAER